MKNLKELYFQLGGTLYVPILNDNLTYILQRKKYDFLKSIVICFEDSTMEKDIEKGLKKLELVLQDYKIHKDFHVFIRPRNQENLKQLLNIKGIEKIKGFVLPKITLENFEEYTDILYKKIDFYFPKIIKQNEKFLIMPTIENIYTDKELGKLKEKFLKYKNKILTIRIGGEDILAQFGLIRKENESYFNNFLMYNYFFNIYSIFKPEFNLSAPVFPFIWEENKQEFNNMKILNIFMEEVENEINIGIFNKTVIHPTQAKTLNTFYKVSKKEYDIAQNILEEFQKGKAVIKYNNRMYEYKVHSKWAKNILNRYNNYGIQE